MAYTLQELSDFEDIRTLKHRYFRGIDTADAALLAGLFTEDLVVDYRGGNYRVQVKGRKDMLEFLANSFSSQAVAMHHGHMPDITSLSHWRRRSTPSVPRSIRMNTGARAASGKSPGLNMIGSSS
jgi:hypothetical protein